MTAYMLAKGEKSVLLLNACLPQLILATVERRFIYISLNFKQNIEDSIFLSFSTTLSGELSSRVGMFR